MEKTCHPKDTSLLEIKMDLAREEVEGISKVVIVSFLYFLFLEFQGFVIILI